MSTKNTAEPAVRAARARRHDSPARTHRWALLIAQRYGLTLAEARAELRRCAANGWQTWEFHAAFVNDCKDDIE